MYRRILFISIAAVLMFSCVEQPKEKEAVEDVYSLTISEMVTNPLDYEGSKVSFDGVIGHMCRHSGDKMRVLQEDDPDYSILVLLGNFADKFSPDFEGEHITVNGMLKTEIRNLEQPVEGEHDHEPGDHSCESTEEAIKKMEELGIEPEMRSYIKLESFEIK